MATQPTPPPAFTANASMVADAIRRLISQFRSGTSGEPINDFEKLVRSYVDELQALDTAATDLLVLTTLDGAEGVQLDGLGQIIGLERNGLDDDLYQSLLRAYIRVNTSAGTIEQINEIVRLATNTSVADQFFRLNEGSPAEFEVQCTGQLGTGLGAIAAEAMYQGKPAGVHGVFIYWETTSPFVFDGGAVFDGGYFFAAAIRNRGARESEIL
jgi:hypothetical protein